MKRECKLYEDFFEKYGYGQTLSKKNARILWNVKNGEIVDLVVEDFSDPDEKQYLYNKYSYDTGNCISDWDEWEFSDILIKIFVSYVVPLGIRKKILFELSKIEEWRPLLSVWIYKNWSNDLKEKR